MSDESTTPADSRPLRILMLATGRVVQPLFGGELRYFHLADELARLGHTVELHGWLSRNHAAQKTAQGRLTICEHHSVRLDLAQVFHRLRLIPACELPAWFAGLAPMIAHYASEGRFDVVHYELPWWSRAVESISPKKLVVYGSQNIESVWWGPRLNKFFRAEKWKRRLLENEKRAIERSGGAIACSEQDAQWMRANTSVRPERVAVVPNGFDARRFNPPEPAMRARLRRKFYFNENIKIAVFVGAAVEHNVQAANVIARQIAPLTSGEPIHYVIAGRVNRWLDHARLPNVTYIEQIDDVLELLQAADLALNPMLGGSGSNIKIAEALGAGLPVVTTRFGARGYEEFEKWLSVGEPADLAGLADLIRATQWPNPIPREEVERLSWAASARRLSDFYEKLLK